MINIRFMLSLLIICGLITACEPAPDESEQKSTAASEKNLGEGFDESQVLDEANYEGQMPPDEIVSDNTSDEVCGSLKPLLKLLPAEKVVDGLTEFYRGCEATSEQSVKVAYNQEGEAYTEYQFSVFVLDGSSPYVASYINIDGASDDQKDFLRKGISAIGTMFKVRLNTCKEYAKNPVIPDGRNPLIYQANDIDICVMDNLDTNKEVWNVFAAYKNLGIQLEFQGVKAGTIMTAKAAKEHLEPIFALFKLDADI